MAGIITNSSSVAGFSPLLPIALLEGIDQETLNALEACFSTMEASDAQLVATGQRTVIQFQGFSTRMEEYLEVLSLENSRLEEALCAADSQIREIDYLNGKEVVSLKKQLEECEAAVETMRQEMVASAAKVDQRIVEIKAAKTIAEQTATRLGNSRIAAANQAAQAKVNAKTASYRNQLATLTQFLAAEIQETRRHLINYVDRWTKEKYRDYQDTISVAVREMNVAEQEFPRKSPDIKTPDRIARAALAKQKFQEEFDRANKAMAEELEVVKVYLKNFAG